MNKIATVCICGSFKFYDEILLIKNLFEERGISCKWPTICEHRLQNSESDDPHPTIDDARECETKHLKKIDESEIIYVYDKGGHLGRSVLMEIGYAFAKRKNIVLLQDVADKSVMSFISQIMTPQELVNQITESEIEKTL